MHHHSFFRLSATYCVLVLALTALPAKGAEAKIWNYGDIYNSVHLFWEQMDIAKDKAELLEKGYQTHPEFDVKNKPLNMGTLDYLRGMEKNGWMQDLTPPEDAQHYVHWGSIYRLSNDPIVSGSDVSLNEIQDNMLLRYAITNEYVWCDRENGDIYEYEREGKNDIKVEIRKLFPMLYSFDFKKSIFGDKHTAATGSDGQELINYIDKFDYTIGEAEKTIGYYVPSEYTNTQKKVEDAGIIQDTFYKVSESGHGGALRYETTLKTTLTDLSAVYANFYECASPGGHGGGAISMFGEDNHPITLAGGIYGTFVNNKASKEGGAIWSYGPNNISVIDGVFIANQVSDRNSWGSANRGGAVYLGGKTSVGTITGSFLGNAIYAYGGFGGDNSAAGGALGITNETHVNLIVADFIGNHIIMKGSVANGGDGHGAAIYNGAKSVINYLIGDFYGNYVRADESIDKDKDIFFGHGAAICNISMYAGNDSGGATINYIEGTFVRNYVKVPAGAIGGAIYNNRGGYIHSIHANFVRNYAEAFSPQASYNNVVGQKESPRASGGAIVNYLASTSSTMEKAIINEINGSFYGNYTKANAGSADGGAISNWEGKSHIGTITGNFIGNYTETEKTGQASGGAIYTSHESDIDEINGSFYDNYAKSAHGYARGGAITNGGALGIIRNAVFEGNYAIAGEGGTAHGGAIYNKGTLEILADGAASLFRNNYIAKIDSETGEIDESTKSPEAIYGSGGSKISFIAVNDGAIIVDGIINGDKNGDDGNYEGSTLLKGHTLYLQGYDNTPERQKHDTSGVVVFNDLVRYADIYLEDVSLVIHSERTKSNELDKTLASSYAPGEWQENAQKKVFGKGGQYDHSNVLRESPLFAESGHVILSDGKITDYMFSIVYATGPESTTVTGVYDKGNPIKREESDPHAVFAIDIDMNRQVSDLITVFGIVVPENSKNGHKIEGGVSGLTWLKTPDRDENRLSLSQGYVALNMSFIIDNNSYEKEHQKMDDFLSGELWENKVTVQVLNFQIMEGEQGKAWSPENPEYKQYYDNLKKPNSEIIQLSEILHLDHAKSYMTSADIVADSIMLATTRTYHDSVTIEGWRDPLAAWAELRVNDYTEDESTWGSSKDEEKVFEILAGGTRLTRDIVDKDSPIGENSYEKSPKMTGKDLTIYGHGIAEENAYLLYVAGHNLLQEVGEDQKVTLRHFNLKGVEKTTNYGDLTLDSLRIYAYDAAKDGSTPLYTLTNEGKLTLKGNALISADQKITSASAEGQHELLINDESEVEAYKGKTTVAIEGTVENQNITQSGKGSREEGSFSSETILRVTEAPDVRTLMARLDGQAEDEKLTITEAFKRFRNNSLTLDGGRFSLVGTMPSNTTLHLRELSMQGGTLWVEHSQVDLEKKQMGGIRADKASGNSGEIYLAGMTLMTDSQEKVTHVLFVNEEVGDRVQDDIRDSEIDGKVWTYLVTYADTDAVDSQGVHGKSGYYTFTRTDKVNPDIQAGGATQLTGGYAAMTQIFEYSFEHADLFTTAPLADRNAHLYGGYNVVTPTKDKEGFESCSGVNAKSSGMWVHPYSSFESMALRNGPRVSANLYGALVGGDTDISRLNYGWSTVTSVYGAYLGGKLHYTGNRTTQNGGAVGLTQTFYRNNFHTAVTVSVATLTGDTTNRYGSEDYTMLMGGLAARAGYNIELAEGKYIIQPIMMASYTIFNAFDYTNSAGVRVETEPMQVLQLHPYVRFIKNASCEWKPYATAGMVYNLSATSHFKANGDALPSLGVKPYAEYSLGLQRLWKDRYTIYGQVTGRNGGREGIEISAGTRWNW